MACAGDLPTLETLAAVNLLRKGLPDLKIRVVNVVDLMTLQPKEAHPHGLSNREFDGMFTYDRPVIFAYHDYPSLIHRLTYNRTNHAGMHVRGFKEEGTTTTPFDIVLRNELDRFHLAIEVIERVPGTRHRSRPCQAAVPRRIDRACALYSPARRGYATHPRLDLALWLTRQTLTRLCTCRAMFPGRMGLVASFYWNVCCARRVFLPLTREKPMSTEGRAGNLVASDKESGKAVYGAENKKIGSIEKVMVDKNSGEIAYAVLSFGGFLGIGKDHYPVPWKVLRYDSNLDGYCSDISENRLKGAPKHGTETIFDWDARYAELDDYYNDVVIRPG
jgi:hypothetical protein